MSSSNERRQLDRQVVEPQDSLGFLEHESFGTAVKVIERSNGGFTVAIAPDKAALFPGGDNATLSIGNQQFNVMISGYFREGNRKSHLGLKQISSEDPPKRNTHRLTKSSAKKAEGTNREKFTYGIFVAFLLAMFALPGVGDWVGTAPWIRGVIHHTLARLQVSEAVPASSPHFAK
jgi:hypothetical protein